MGRPDGRKRRDAILDAALVCFLERGVLATGIEEIRKAAKASPSSIYHHFGGLPGITHALLVRTFEGLFGYLAEEVTKTKTAESAVKTLVARHLTWVLTNRDDARFMYQAMALELATPELAERKAELLRPVVTHLSKFMSTGELPRWSPLVFDVVLLGPSHEACRRFLAGADLTSKWMGANLPRLAWQTVSAERPMRQK